MAAHRPTLNVRRTAVSNFDTYIICSTPRTGSTLLCELLASSGVAGNPHSYFRSEDIDRRASQWGLRRGWRFDAYVEAVRVRTATPNGVLGLRIMWGTLDEILHGLRSPGGVAGDRALLEAAFGSVRYVYLRRDDIVRQAISLFKAEQSNYWHSTQSRSPSEVQYDHDEIARRVDSLQNDNLAWNSWFESTGVEPLSTTYEELDLDPMGTAATVLRHLGLDASGELSAPNERLADETNQAWHARFLREAGDT